MDHVYEEAGKVCSVTDCNWTLLGDNGGVMYRFPKDENLKRQWMNACNITQNITNNTLVCSSHFTKEDYTSGTKNKILRLNKAAVPTQNLSMDFEEFIPYEELDVTKNIPCSVENSSDISNFEIIIPVSDAETNDPEFQSTEKETETILSPSKSQIS